MRPREELMAGSNGPCWNVECLEEQSEPRKNRSGSRTLSVGAERVPSLGGGESEQHASNMVAVHARQGLQPLDEQDQSSGDIREIRNLDGHDIRVMIKPQIHSRERQKLVAAQMLKYRIPGRVRVLAQHGVNGRHRPR